jgi:hypothetical protein
MCQSPDGTAPGKFLEQLKERAKSRRKADVEKAKKGGDRAAPWERSRRMLTYACSTTSKNDYVGYSGPAGGMSGKNYGKAIPRKILWKAIGSNTPNILGKTIPRSDAQVAWTGLTKPGSIRPLIRSNLSARHATVGRRQHCQLP